MRILYLGLPLGAIVLARAGFVPRVIGLGHPEAPGGSRVRRRFAQSLLLGRPDLDDDGVVRALASIRPDALLSFFWPRRIPPRVLALPRLGAYGVHPSLLPRHRGPDPYYWTLREGDAETGVCLHRLEADYDTGDVIASRRVAVRPDHDAWTLARTLDRPALQLLVAAAGQLAHGAPLVGARQDERAATMAPSPSDDDLSLDWHTSVDDVLRQVRAAAPMPGAVAEVEGLTVEVVRAAPHEGRVPQGLEVAEAFVDGEQVVVVAGDGAVRILLARDEEGEPLDLATHVRAAQAARAQRA